MKIGLIQQSFKGSKQASINHSVDAIMSLAKKGAKLVVLGELHQGEYFCQHEDVGIFDLANDYQKDLAFWASVAKKAGVVLVTSLFEKRAAGLYHNTAFVFESTGEIAGKYRKMHIPDDPSYYEKFYFTPGDTGFYPIKTSVGSLGVLICWDQWFPEAARLMALRGAQILIYPTAIGHILSESEEERTRQKDSWICIQKSHSIANNIPVISVNRHGFEKDPSGVGEGLHFWGTSLAYAAGGRKLYLGGDGDEEILVDVDMKESEQLRRWWPFLRDRRIEHYAGLCKLYDD